MGCGARRPQRTLLRIASYRAQVPEIDRGFSHPGRGAYLCIDESCALRARKRRSLERALRLPASVPRSVWEEIDREIDP